MVMLRGSEVKIALCCHLEAFSYACPLDTRVHCVTGRYEVRASAAFVVLEMEIANTA
jgi:hypothetical protein